MIDLEACKIRLIELRAQTAQLIELSKSSAQPVELDQTLVGRVSRMDAMQQQEMALATKRRRGLLLQQIEQALKRVDAGDYGYCAICDEEIAAKRLEANPVILTCVSCAK